MKSILTSVSIIAILGFSGMLLLEKKTTLSDFSTLTYNVGEDKKLDGPYTVESPEKKTWLRGSYKGDNRSGNWYCFNSSGRVFLRYNYDQKKLVQLDTTAMKNVQVNILVESVEAKENASIPVPICSMDQYMSLFGSQIARIFDKEVNLPSNEIEMAVVASLDTKDRVSYKLEYNLGKTTFSAPLKMQETKFDLAWVPASYNGKSIPSEFIVKSIYKKGADEKYRFKWNY